MANTVRNLLGPPLRLRGPGDSGRRRQDGCRPGLRRRPDRPREPVHDRPSFPATACRTGHLDVEPSGCERAVRDQCRRRSPRRPFRRGVEHLRRRGHRSGRRSGCRRGTARPAQRVTGVAGRREGAPRGRLLRRPARPDRRDAVPKRAGGGVGGDAATERPGHGVVTVDRAGRRGRVPGDRRAHAVPPELVARRCDLGRGRRQQRGAGDSGGGLGAAGADPGRRHRGIHEVPRSGDRASAVARRHPRGDGHQRSGHPGGCGADAGRVVRPDLSAAAGFRSGGYRRIAVVAHRRRHRGQPDRWRSTRCPTSTSTG